MWNKETVKLYGLACDVVHKLCTERGDLVPRKFDLTWIMRQIDFLV